MKLIIAAVALVALVAGGIFFVDHRDKAAAHERDYGPCGVVVVSEAAKRLADLRTKMDDAERLASVTSRVSLAGPLESLQRLAREARTVDVPKCMEPARFLLATEGDIRVESFMAFAAQRSDLETTALLMTANRYRKFYDDAVAKVKACAPACPEVAWDAERETRAASDWKRHDLRVAQTGR